MSHIKVTVSIYIHQGALLFSLLLWHICNHVSNANLLHAANWFYQDKFLSCFICTNFQWTEDRQGFLIQYLLDPDQHQFNINFSDAQLPDQISRVKYWI